MATVIDAHKHLITGTPGNEYLSPHYRMDRVFGWAYSGSQWALDGYDRDPMDLYPRMEARVADPDGSATIAAMDKGGVDASVLIHSDFGPSRGDSAPKSVEEAHQDFANLQKKYPGRLYAFAGPDVRRPGALELVEKAITEWDARGLKVMPQFGYYPSDRILYPFYQLCLEHDLPVAICTNYESAYSRAIFNDPIHITSLVADFPDLNVIIFHSGYPFDHWFQVSVQIARSAYNVYLEFAGWNTGGGGKRPDLTEEQRVRMLGYARDMVGAHKMIMGTDMQHSNSAWGERRLIRYERDLEEWRDLPAIAKKYGVAFSQEEVDLMMGLNIGRLIHVVDMPKYNKRKYGWSVTTPPPRLSP